MLNKLFFVILFLSICASADYSPQRPLSYTTDSVTVTNSGLPTGASTSALQTSGNSILTSIANSVGGTLATSVSNFPSTQAVTGTFWQATQPVSGTFWQATQPISAASLPLPSGAATSALQTTINSTLGSPFQAGGSIGNSSFGISGTLPAFASTPTFNLGTLNGAATSSNQTTTNSSLSAIDTKLGGTLIVNGSGVTQPISASALPLPSGAATSALQTSGGQKSQIVDGVTGVAVGINLTGELKTRTDPMPIFNESFEGGTVDTTNRWNAAVVSGAGSVTQGSSLGLVVSVGTGANSAAAITSQPSFATQYASSVAWASGMKFESTTATGNYRYFGLGTAGTSYSTTNPIANGIGFEITTSGVLRAVVYASDVLLYSQNLTIPTDGIEHVYFFSSQGSYINWYLDTAAVPVASNYALGIAPDLTVLPIRYASLNAGSSTVGTPAMTVYGSSILDTNRVSNQLSDGTYPWRKATIDVNGDLATYNPDVLVTGQSAQTATVNNILTATSGTAATDLTGYKSASVQVVSTGSGGTFIFEGSNDNTNWITLPVFNQLILTGTPITAAVTASASQIIYSFPATTRYVRLRIATTITGGSIQAFSKFMQAPFSPAVQNVANATAANLTTSATIASGTVTTVTTLTTLANGQTAHSAASTGSPVRTGGRVISTLDTTLVQGDASDLPITTGQQLVTKPFATSENDWQASSGITALATTTSTQLVAAGAASIRNFVTGCQIVNTSATVSTTVSVLDGSTVLWTSFLPATTAALQVLPINVDFPTPLRGTAATAMNIQLGTVSANVYYNCQGYRSF